MTTEKEKMLAGELYDASDAQLVEERRRARRLLKAYNHTLDEDEEKRREILAELLGARGEGLWIEPPFFCDYGSNITTGRNVYFNFNCVVLDVARVEIGDDVLFGPAVQIYTATHDVEYTARATGLELGQAIRIGAGAWIGGAAVIGPGVTIGERSVIGAGSVVVKDVPADVFAAGNPCRVIREINRSEG